MSERYKRETLKINRKHEEFARRLLTDTKTPEYQIYKEVFGLKSDNKSTLSGSACQLKTHPVFAAYLESVRAEIGAKFMITIEGQIEKLEKIISAALEAQTRQCGPAVNAVMAQAKLAGIDKVVEEKTGAEALADALVEMAKKLPG